MPPHFIQIGLLNDKCYVQIPDSIWSKRTDLEKKQITEAVEKGFISDVPGGIGIKKSPRYHISIKSDYRLCAQKKPTFESQKFKWSELYPYFSPYQGRTPATTSEQRRWFEEEKKAEKKYKENADKEITINFMLFNREKNHKTINSA